MKRILVIGATGDQGHPLLQRLEGAGLETVALLRNPEALKNTPFAHVPTVTGDLDNPGSLKAAFAGIDGIAMHLPFVFDRALADSYGKAIAEAAVAAGVKKLVFNTSCFIADRDLDLSAHDGRRAIEARIMESGLAYAIFEPTVFMDNMIRSWSKPSIVTKDIFAYPAKPTLRINWICLDDVAAYMTAALAKPDTPSGRYPVGGPETLVGDEVAARLSEAAGKTVTFQSLTPDEFASKMSMLVTGSPDVEPASIYDRMAEFYRFYNSQPTSPLALDPQPPADLFGVTLTPLVEWAKRQDWADPTDPALAVRMAGKV